jgi:sec-independent protein translocase protein TatA
MIGNIGFPELLVILVIALLLFGTRLPAVGKSLGEGIKAFKKGIGSDDKDAENNQTSVDARKHHPNPSPKVLAQERPSERIHERTDERTSRDQVVDVEHRDVHKS